MQIKTCDAEKFIDSITKEERESQTEYWARITPTTADDVFRRWIFAFTSIHTGWQGNVMGYNALKDFVYWKYNSKELARRLADSGCGLHNNRAKFIWEFKKKFWETPELYMQKPTTREEWKTLRNKWVDEHIGIGIAKVSYALELTWPLEAMLTCLDIHHTRAYGGTKNLTDSPKDRIAYEMIEQHWVDYCNYRNIAPSVARQIYWNRKFEKPSSFFWSWCLHTFETSKIFHPLQQAGESTSWTQCPDLALA